MKKVFFLIVVTIIAIVPGLRAQRVMQLNPDQYSFRAVSMGSLYTAMAVGDSGYVAIGSGPNGSLTWTLRMQSGFGTSTTLYSVAYAGDTAHAVIGGEQGSLAWTSDGGGTWTPVTTLGTTATIRGLTWNNHSVLVGVGDGGLIIRSSDLGKTWNIIKSNVTVQLNAVIFGTPSAGVAVGNDTTILQSNDSGKTWTRVQYPAAYADSLQTLQDSGIVAPNFTCVAMAGGDTMWVGMERPVAISLIYRGGVDPSGDGFIAWPHSGPLTGLIYTGMQDVMLVASSLDDFFYDNVFDTNIYNTVGSAWFAETHTITGDADGGRDPIPLRFRCVAFWREDTAMTIVQLGDQSELQHYWTNSSYHAYFNLDGTWLNSIFAASNALSVDILPNGYGFAVCTEDFFQRTTDGGHEWTGVATPIVNLLNNYDSAINTVYTIDSSTAIVIGEDGIIFKYDSSASHLVKSGTSFRLHGIAFPSKDTGIIVGDYGTILQSTDQGNTWQPIPPKTTQYLYSVAFANNLTGIAVGDSGTILRTTDEGNTWKNVPNQYEETDVSIRQVQAFPDGTFFARAGAFLISSTDTGKTWQLFNPQPPDGDTAGMSFYSPSIGIVTEKLTSSALVSDTAFFAYTTDGGTTWPGFTIPMFVYNQVFFHWVSDHEVLLYGIWGFEEDVNFSESGVSVTQINQTPDFSVYPNPSSGEISVDYTSKTSGPVSIELCDETGRTVKTLFTGEEGSGDHEHSLDISKEARGAYFVRLTRDGKASVAPVSVE